MQYKLSLYIPSFLKEFKTAHISSIWAPTLNVPFSHVYPELGGDRFYSQFRLKKQSCQCRWVHIETLQQLQMRAACTGFTCMQHPGQTFMCMQWWGSAAGLAIRSASIHSKHTCRHTTVVLQLHLCIYHNSYYWGVSVENLLMRLTAVNKSLLLLQRKRTLDLCMPIVETPRTTPLCRNVI